MVLRRSHDERHWDEFNETKTLARLPTAKVLRGPPDGEDVESSEILIPDSLTDFTQVDDEAERRRNARAPLSDVRIYSIYYLHNANCKYVHVRRSFSTVL